MIKGVLSLSDFTLSTPVAGVNSTVASYQVPLGVFYKISAQSAISLRIPASQTFTYTSAQTSNTVTVTVNAPVAVIGNYYNAPNYALSAVGIWSNGTTSQMLYAINVNGNTITFQPNDTTSTNVTFTVYYLLNVGKYSWTVGVPLGNGTYNAEIKSSAITSVNSKDQISTGSLVTFDRDVVLPENFSLNLSVLSSPAAALAGNILAVCEIPVMKGDMRELKLADPNYLEHITQNLTLFS